MYLPNCRKSKTQSIRTIVVLAVCASILTGCGDNMFFSKKDPVVAEVGDRRLFQSQLKNLVPDGTSKADSMAIVDGFVQNWVRERLMVEDAAEHIAADINIDKLVDDYRSSLLVYHYENRLTSKMLDTLIAEVEMREYYEIHKNNYILTHPAFRCIIARVPLNARGIENLNTALQRKDLTEGLFLVRELAEYHQLDTSLFMTLEDVVTLLPEGSLANLVLREGSLHRINEGKYAYFLRVLSYHPAGTAPPYEHIADNIKKIILSERRIQLLKKYRQDLYNQGLESKRFKIFKID
jgi:hypothetical protein